MAAPSSLIAAATLLVRMLCSSEPMIEALEALITRSDRSCTWRVAEDTSAIEA
ncbi:hypothetical protein D3C84_1217200 [compost metagenome]